MLCDQIPNPSNVLVNDVSSMSLEDEHDKPYKIPKLDWPSSESISITSFDLNEEEKCRGLHKGQIHTAKNSPFILKR